MSSALPMSEPPTQQPPRKSIIGCMEGRFRHLTREDVKLTPEEIDELFGEKRDKAKEARLAW